GQEPGTGLDDPGLLQAIGLDGDARANRVAVALRPRETDGDSAASALRGKRREIIPEDPHLRRLSRRHDHEIRIAIAIDVEDREGAPVLVEIESERPRDLVEAAVAVVAQ